jgi:prepilin-type N-terminal cleavage/methylation domain-containing protein
MKAHKSGFTLIELLVAITIVATLSAVILFAIAHYINRGKDARVQGELGVLVSAGEVFYNNHPNQGYKDFCISSVVTNALSKIPTPQVKDCGTGLCCNVKLEAGIGTAWAVCAQEFTDNSKAFCVDSSGAKKEIDNSYCISTAMTDFACSPNP